MSRVSIDVLHFEERNFLHSVDEATSWSEAMPIVTKTISHQISVLERMNIWRQGAPLIIRCDNEYNNKEFQEFYLMNGTQIVPVAANDHEANGLIENSNKTLRQFCDRLQISDKRSTSESIISEALFGKNILKGAKVGSTFQLLYGRHPHLLKELDEILPPPATVQENTRKVARHSLRKMLRTPHFETPHFSFGDKVAIWRDGSGWLAPARVTCVTPIFVEFEHNKRLRTSGLNRTRLVEGASEVTPVTYRDIATATTEPPTDVESDFTVHTDSETSPDDGHPQGESELPTGGRSEGEYSDQYDGEVSTQESSPNPPNIDHGEHNWPPDEPSPPPTRRKRHSIRHSEVSRLMQ